MLNRAQAAKAAKEFLGLFDVGQVSFDVKIDTKKDSLTIQVIKPKPPKA